MKALSIHAIAKDGTSLSARLDGRTIHVRLSGNLESTGILGGYLKQLHAEAVRVDAELVVVDCDELYFMSAACVKCFAPWIQKLTEMEATRRYKIKFRANPNFLWQGRTFDSLRRYGPSHVIVEGDSSAMTSAPRSGTLRNSAVSPASNRPPRSATMPQVCTVPETPAARRKP